MSTENNKRLILSAKFTLKEIELIEKIVETSGVSLSTVVRGLFRIGLEAKRKNRVSTLELIRAGSMAE